jgi:hypothetical protein
VRSAGWKGNWSDTQELRCAFFYNLKNDTELNLKAPRRPGGPASAPPPAQRRNIPGVLPTHSDAAAEAQRKTRTYLTDEDKVVLMNLCVDYQADHVRNKKTEFWSMISELLEQTAGVTLKEPQKTVRGLVAKRKATVKVQLKESGRDSDTSTKFRRS